MPIPPGAAAPQNSESVQFLWLEPAFVRTVVLPFLRAGVPAVALIEEMIIQPGLFSRRLAMNCQWPLQY